MRGGDWFLRWVLVIQFMAALAVVEQSRAVAFQNLDFENVNVEPTSGNPYDLPTVTGVPGWSFSHANPPQLLWHIGNTPQQYLSSDLYADDNGLPIGTPLEGHYTLAMSVGFSDASCGINGIPCEWEGPSVEQTGDVPAGTKMIRLFAAIDPLSLNAVAMYVTLNGIDVPLSLLPSGQMTGNVSAFAGTTSILKIQLNAEYRTPDTAPDMGSYLIDAIEFTPAPEPASAALLAMGIFGIAAVRRRSHR
jgi:hypothetical protein